MGVFAVTALAERRAACFGFRARAVVPVAAGLTDAPLRVDEAGRHVFYLGLERAWVDLLRLANDERPNLVVFEFVKAGNALTN